MASSDYIVNGTPFNLYKEQEGYSINFSSALHVDCSYRTGPANISRAIHLTAEQSAQDPELPDALHGKECIFFRGLFKAPKGIKVSFLLEHRSLYRFLGCCSKCKTEKCDWTQ